DVLVGLAQRVDVRAEDEVVVAVLGGEAAAAVRRGGADDLDRLLRPRLEPRAVELEVLALERALAGLPELPADRDVLVGVVVAAGVVLVPAPQAEARVLGLLPAGDDVQPE